MAGTVPTPEAEDHADRGVLAFTTAALNAVGTVWIVALMLLIVSDIAMRNIANQPIRGVPEMVSFSIVGIVFLQLAHVLRVGALTRSDLLLDILAKRAPLGRRWLLAAFNITGAIILAIALWKFWPSFTAAWAQPGRHFMGSPGVFVLPRWPLYGIMCLGMALTVIQFLALTFSALKGGRA